MTPRIAEPTSVPISEIRPLTASPPFAVSPTRSKLPEFQLVWEPGAANSSSSEPPPRSYMTRRSWYGPGVEMLKVARVSLAPRWPGKEDSKTSGSRVSSRPKPSSLLTPKVHGPAEGMMT